MQARAAVWAGRPADGQALRDQNAAAAARADLTGVGRRHSDHSSPSVCCCGCEDAQELAPARVLNRLGQIVVLEQVGDLQVFMRDRVVLSHELECRLVVEVGALPPHCLG